MAELKMLAIDLGASSGRGIIGKFDGQHLHISENHRFLNEPVIAAGSFNWDILRIYHEIKNSIRKAALGDDNDIASIGIDTWGVDYGFLDKNGHMISNPHHYRDPRTDNIPSKAFEIMSKDDLYDITGIQTLNFNTVFQLLADLRDNPHIFDMASSMLFIPDLLNYFLTGIKKTEYTIASTGALLDAGLRDWSFDVIEKFGIPKHIFTDISAPGTKLGRLLPDVQSDIGGISPIVINTPSHDTASAVVAVPAKGNDFVYISSGTWSLMGCELKAPCINQLSKKYDFTNEGGMSGTIRFLKNIMGLWIEQESRRQWAREGKVLSFDDLSNAADSALPLRSIINPNDQIFSAPGNMPARIMEYCEKTSQPIPTCYGEIVRCILESLALCYRYFAEKAAEIRGNDNKFINIVGGGCKEEMLCRFTANACGIPVYAGPVEATAVGNIVSQAIALGEITDIQEARHIIRNSCEIKMYEPDIAEKAAWDEAYERFCRLIDM